MDRDSIFLLPEGTSGTFAQDDSLPPLPLPKLDESLERYFQSLKPFGTEEELSNSRKLIDDFLQGDGPKLQAVLEKKAEETKNWMEKWWEDYAYLAVRTPLTPKCLMATTVFGEMYNIPETPEHFLQTASNIIHYTATCWWMIYNERIKPTTNPAGTVTFSSATYMRLYNSCRQPGLDIDVIKSYFKRKSEGTPPTHAVIIGRGRFFVINMLNADRNLVSIQYIHKQLQMIDAALLEKNPQPSVAFLTQDERTSWATNRNRILEISPQNRETLELIESSIFTYVIDDRMPATHTEAAQMSVSGGVGVWADKSCSSTIFRNGKMGFMGEHSCYDGTMTSMMNYFIMLSIVEQPEINYDEPLTGVETPREIRFDLDDNLHSEITRMEDLFEKTKSSVKLVIHCFEKYGKDFMKKLRIHPDAYIQAVIQLAYYRVHNTIASCYETATMREYYHGRTETVRSCDMKMAEMCKGWSKSTYLEKLGLFRAAAESQMSLMNAARLGHGVDRHLMGLQCAAMENGFPVPKIMSDDPLYVRSGGGGNFTLSTSTLGYTINMGLVAPMVDDGYGCFYSILPDVIWCMITTFRESTVADETKFAAAFDEVMNEVKQAFDQYVAAGAK